MTPRAIRSISWAETPGLTARKAASCASATIAWISRASVPGSPTHGPGHVGAVPAHATAEVQHDRIAVAGDPVAGVMVGRSPVRARAHDREGDRIQTGLQQMPGEQPGHLPFGTIPPPLAEDSAKGFIRAEPSLREEFDFAVVLPRSKA